MTTFTLRPLVLALATVTLVACNSENTKEPTEQKAMISVEEANQREAAAREEERRLLEERYANLLANQTANADADTDDMDLPDAKPGECYARIVVPAEYRTYEEQVKISDEDVSITVIPAEYRTVTKEVLVSPERQEIVEVIPAKYDWVEREVIVKPAYEKLEQVDAITKEVEEQVLVRPAYETWKRGEGPIQKIDEETGEIMCLVTVPAEYKTVKKTVLVQPKGVQRTEVPAETKIVKEYVKVEDEQTVYKTIPAEYETVEVQELVKEAEYTETPIPAEYGVITKTEKVKDSYTEWRSILCKTNFSEDLVRKLQQTLSDKGYLKPTTGDQVVVDGIYGNNTLNAVKAYQKDHDLAYGELTIEVLQHLNVID